MKAIKYLLFFSLIFSACKKDHDESPLNGQWQWYKTNVIYSGGTLTPQNTNRTWALNFDNDYIVRQSGDLFTPANGTYDIGRSYDMDYVNIHFPDSSMSHYFTLTGTDTLHFGTGPVADGDQHYFVRVR